MLNNKESQDHTENIIPQYLYHYTSIETLALILKNRSIRFNSLDRMDDLQEKEAKDIQNIGQFIYVSAWTSDQQESIPMWNMYASLNAGIRIQLQCNPFFIYDNTAQDLQKVAKMNIIDETQGKSIHSYIPLSDIFGKGFYCLQTLSGPILHKVEYTQDEAKLYPSILNNNREHFSVILGEMGKCKNTHWDFQKEWRYILHILPLNLNQNVNLLEPSFQMVANRVRVGVERQPFPYYDMKIDDRAFASMKITASPNLSPGNMVILETLVARYNPTAIISKSALQDLI